VHAGAAAELVVGEACIGVWASMINLNGSKIG
jgi:hypothetical protein